jgi:type III secretory pathway component EscS
MHAAAVFGVLGMLASLARIIQQLTRGEFEFDLKGICLVGMVVISGTFIALCVKSFKDARKAREA